MDPELSYYVDIIICKTQQIIYQNSFFFFHFSLLACISYLPTDYSLFSGGF